MRHLCVIPARGGSKALPKKNVVPLRGVPMLAYTIEAARASGLFPQVFVVSDDAAIRACAQRYGAAAVEEPGDLAGDAVSSMEPVLWLADREEGDWIWNLQPTSPLRGPDDLRRAAKTIEDRPEADFVASVSPVDPHDFHWALREEEGFLRFWRPEWLADRSALPPAWRPDGAIKAGRREALAARRHVFGERLAGLAMPRHRSIHVRDVLDLDLCALVLARHAGEFGWAPAAAVELRAAGPGDERYVWEVNNAPSARQASIRREPIPWEAHARWFRAALADGDRAIFVVLRGGEPCGVARYDVRPERRDAVVSLAVAEGARGRGVGRAAFRAAAQAALARAGVDVALAFARPENAASARALAAAGFSDEGAQEVDGVALRRFSFRG